MSPNILFCSKVLELVQRLSSEMHFECKIVTSLPMYRALNAFFNSQYGKFITIYPKSDSEACQIADKLNIMFKNEGLSEKCFLEVPNDFKIYDGIYCRLGYYRGNTEEERLEDSIYRAIPSINSKIACEQAAKIGTCFGYYQHPFSALYMKSKKMPKEVCKINDAIYNSTFYILKKAGVID